MPFAAFKESRVDGKHIIKSEGACRVRATNNRPFCEKDRVVGVPGPRGFVDAMEAYISG